MISASVVLAYMLLVQWTWKCAVIVIYGLVAGYRRGKHGVAVHGAECDVPIPIPWLCKYKGGKFNASKNTL